MGWETGQAANECLRVRNTGARDRPGGFLIASAFTLLAGLMALVRIDSRIEEIGDFHAPSLRAVQALALRLSEGVEESLTYVISGDAAEKQGFLDWARDFESQAEKYRNLARFDLPEEQFERDSFAQIQKSQRVLVSRAMRMFEVYEARGSVGPESFQAYEAAVDLTLDDLDALILLESSEMDAAQELARKLLVAEQRLILGAGSFALLLATASACSALGNFPSVGGPIQPNTSSKISCVKRRRWSSWAS